MMDTFHAGVEGLVEEEPQYCPEGHPVETGEVVCPRCLAVVHRPGGPVWTPNDR